MPITKHIRGFTPLEKKNSQAFSVRRNSLTGFTLIELIVSIGLFSFVMVITATAYLSLINADSQSQASADVTSNLSYILENMAGSIRTGSNYSCDGGNGEFGTQQSDYCMPGGFFPQNGSNCFSFIDAKGSTFFYAFDSAQGTINRGESRSCDLGDSVPITDPSVHVDSLGFYAMGVDPAFMESPSLQARVVIVLSGYMNVRRGSKTVVVPFALQTQATQRKIDN